jgi:hypothetical protein
MVICNVIKYNCIKCSTVVPLEIRPNMQERTIELWRDMIDSKLCLCCVTNIKNTNNLLN